MYVRFCEIYALLLQLVVETLTDAIINWKKWLNDALMTQKLHRNHVDLIQQSTDKPVLKRNHVDLIQQSTDKPVLKLLLSVAHADQIFQQHPHTIESYQFLKQNRAKLYNFRAFWVLWELTAQNPQRNCFLLSESRLDIHNIYDHLLQLVVACYVILISWCYKVLYYTFVIKHAIQ